MVAIFIYLRRGAPPAGGLAPPGPPGRGAGLGAGDGAGFGVGFGFGVGLGFGCGCGLQQSPLLFSLVVEIFGFLCEMAGFFVGFCASYGECTIPFLQYADNSLVFCGASPKDNKGIAAVLGCFELIMGLKVNFKKLTVVGVGTNPLLLRLLLRCLGLPLSSSQIRKANWNPIIERLE